MTAPGAGRVAAALRVSVLVGVSLAAVGVAGWLTHQMLLATSLGPTAYVMLVRHSGLEARVRNAVVGHAVAFTAGLVALAVFGLWTHPSVVELHRESLTQSIAQGVAVGLTVLVLALFDIHHAPAAATALLVSSGISRPGPPLIGLVVGLAVTILLTSALSRYVPVPARRLRSSDGQEHTMAVDPKRADIERFTSEDDGGPVVMLNLLRFADGGRADYDEYARQVGARFLPAVGGEVLYSGTGSTALVSGEDGPWDAVLLVRYPSRAAFLTMVSDPEYREVSRLRTKALRSAVLQATAPWRQV
ncbi:HPP family protein [Kutzneria sp. NPDC051319]|uniref:HPP family protein n=1 Tax=Kutzneria sp. NPDC051319 TaxID=3155047 RepID=UPI003422CDE2